MTDQKGNTERVKDQSQTRAKPRHPRDATHGLECERILKMEVEGRLVETIVIKPDGVASPAQKLKPMKTTHFPRIVDGTNERQIKNTMWDCIQWSSRIKGIFRSSRFAWTS